ncbi:hypothetical protein CC86DRAFT_296903 [Ophiobolus disseminans]|uniref:Rhodopsin domain-containing protein n=1 Tax=Ophiobolus disseminans TaxID=1469910 RepID=A0A6A6ZUT1_9PLEO|nr:hypothetical protein CC86DRAFT_296903 [Ophiobolus disseminans]
MLQHHGLESSLSRTRATTGEKALGPYAHSIAHAKAGVAIACVILAVIAIAMRLYSRIQLLKVLAIEDTLLVLATIEYLAFVALNVDSFRYGLCKHQWDITRAELFQIAPLTFAGGILFGSAMYTAKLSMLLQIKHIFTAKNKNSMFWMSWFLIGIVTCVYTLSLVISLIQCQPLVKIWNPSVAGVCHFRKKGGLVIGIVSLVTVGAVNRVTDLALLALPIMAVSRLQLNMTKARGMRDLCYGNIVSLRSELSIN